MYVDLEEDSLELDSMRADLTELFRKDRFPCKLISKSTQCNGSTITDKS